ncbi:MAG: hypothetical protein COZ27_00290 [Candidatus Moranbacteria bacterium CG_4_10_14_3_um_filter_41_65]|nr:MAG: hypothetical protein COX32_04710 [Candidatus Moranbacteria bacterium CG23_combo_of_CG06-09_8_20_14_all_41_28]PIV86251.1 MAG: hypothetical protein COW50_02500 [Candidatus Moranbacteria bacterium CG17_big_fil_post_rev_8_21_14_2_50_41_107]PIW93734.1 MAG: hypothetical protein COZ86_04805 [Candidatus Moranbacteria bacterium CG_4_8_14_3_um_filter_41_13]PIX91910.1 MAG: hypothetical protein COZ27_00290 [Candidatus Moranbacteria bacterium CG_4_10_14_3_um_filter_41_65]
MRVNYMKKIHFAFIIAVLALCAGIWYWKSVNSVKKEVVQQLVEQQLPSKEENQEQNLVWYPVPELGVRFKVTLDMSDNLKYSMVYDETTRQPIAYFYLQSIHDFEEKQGIPCVFYMDDSPRIGVYSSCSDFALRRVNIDNKTKAVEQTSQCGMSIEKMRTEKYFICYSHSQAVSITGDRDAYKEMYKGKVFDIFLDTIEDADNKNSDV